MGLDKIGKYTVLGKIAEGAMGQVYRAHDPLLNRPVAIKTIAPSFDRDAEFRQRFEREAQAAAQLNHPHIITVFDFGEEGGMSYMAMELLEGQGLRETIDAGRPVALQDKLDLMQQICDGVGFAHAKGIVHRDLKPSNIHIQPNGQAKVLDFGLARIGRSDMTRAGTVMGTPHYMSPEQVRGEKADPRSDVFSLGGIFYEVLTGRRPFGEDSSHRIFDRILGEEPPPIRQAAPRTPDLVAAVVERALGKKPTERFADAAAMAATLRRVQQSLPPRLLQDDPAATAFGDAEQTLLVDDGITRTMPPIDASQVVGSTALAPDPMPQTQTLVSTAQSSATAVGAATETGPRSRLWIGAVGVLLVVAAGAIAWMLLRRPPTLTPGEAAQEHVGILTDALVTSQIELAREDLNNRDYEAAVRRAERALELAPGSADAEEVRAVARRTLEERDAAVLEARNAFEAGDADRATQALGRVLSLDPRHAVVGELSSALNERFRQQAQSARDEARQARASAGREGAGELDGFSVAGGLEREAAALFHQKEFTAAAQKWSEARDAFDSARRAARIARATPAPTAVPATPTPAVVRSGTPPPTTPPPAASAPSLAARGTPVSPTVPRPTPGRAPPPEPTPAAVVATPDPRAAVQQVIATYERVFESRDLALFRTIKPNLSADEEKGYRKAFGQIKNWEVDLTVESVDLDGDRAVVRTSRHDILDGRQQPPKKQVFRLVRLAGQWRIESFEFPR